MVDSLLASLGLYGGTFVVGFLAGMFPLLSSELLLFGLSAWGGLDAGALWVLIGMTALGHQIAKTVTYYAGAGALELPRGRVRERIAKAQRYIDRWNRWPRLVLFLAAATGIPPLFALGFVAKPLMHLSFTTFTVVSLTGRLLRYIVVVFLGHLV